MTARTTNRRASEEPTGVHGNRPLHQERGIPGQSSGWSDDDESDGGPSRPPLTAQEARDLLARSRSVSPWVVVGVQAAVGVCVALLAVLLTGQANYGWSALYGAAVVVVSSALMARGMTSRLSSLTPGLSVVSVLAWELVKISVSLVMLVLAGRLVQHLSWPAMLVAMALCLQVYWVALRWRGR